MTNTTARWSVVLIALALVATACGGDDEPEAADPEAEPEGGELTFTLWTTDEAQLAMFEELADEFAEDFPGTTVAFESIPQEEYEEAIAVRIAGDDAPDAGWLGEPRVAMFADAGQVVDLTDTLADDPEYDLDDFFDPAMGNWMQDGRVFGLPFSTSPYLIGFNRDLFAETGQPTPEELAADGEWTWERFADLAAEMAGELPDGTYPYESNEGGLYSELVFANTTPLVRAYGGDVWDPETGGCTLNAPESVEGFELLHSMVFEDGSVVPPGEEANFFAGQAATTMTQLSRVPALADVPFEWGLAPLPAGPAGETHFIGQAGMVVFSDAPNRDLAVEFVKFLTTEDNVRRMAEFFPPARESVLDDPVFVEEHPLVEPEDMSTIIADGIREGRSMDFPVEWARVLEDAQPAFDGLWRADADVESELSSICEAIEPHLD